MKPSVPLTGLAARYWKRHAKRLTEAGILTDYDVEAFTACCQLWERSQSLRAGSEADPKANRAYLDSVKAWQSLARQFALLPLERKRSGIQTEPDEVDEFGIPV